MSTKSSKSKDKGKEKSKDKGKKKSKDKGKDESKDKGKDKGKDESKDKGKDEKDEKVKEKITEADSIGENQRVLMSIFEQIENIIENVKNTLKHRHYNITKSTFNVTSEDIKNSIQNRKPIIVDNLISNFDDIPRHAIVIIMDPSTNVRTQQFKDLMKLLKELIGKFVEINGEEDYVHEVLLIVNQEKITFKPMINTYTVKSIDLVNKIYGGFSLNKDLNENSSSSKLYTRMDITELLYSENTILFINYWFYNIMNIDIFNHELQPEYISLLTKNETTEILQQYKTELMKLPIIYDSDPVAYRLGAKPGQVIMTRSINQGSIGYTTSYRVCMKDYD